ncbi:hypothetical protein [Pollutimonas subterranea]|uniref:hypothetical protein n=1 Tax=Pollutimonas subterranea TaxID=2045210 RepID=UPI00118035FB|nr:hypothetical protein [Pollutimonas subterranea]
MLLRETQVHPTALATAELENSKIGHSLLERWSVEPVLFKKTLPSHLFLRIGSERISEGKWNALRDGCGTAV